MNSTTRPPDFGIGISRFARFVMGLFGWKADEVVPNYPKMIVIGAPHTTNWDGVILVAASLAMRVRLLWLGKHTLFRPPFGWLMRLAGGIPINRQTTRNAVEQAVQAFNERERMVLVIAPEGTRRKVDHWKTGFYYIALGAGVPIAFGYVDYDNKRAGIPTAFMPTGDIQADFEIIRAFYKNQRGKHPENVGPIIPPPDKPSAAPNE
jgi:1-acyl-sn-glycerol-3-phosphate acyltransferase